VQRQLQIRQFPCLSDNYGFLIHDPSSGETACIDTPEADAIEAALADAGWRLTQIWNTHWHPDHAGGNAALVARHGARVIGPAEVERIAARPDRVVKGGDVAALGGLEAQVLDVSGHTLGHIAFHFAQENVAFVGDALFALGCGRLFEGDPAMGWAGLSRLAALPPETAIYCAHEYTASNARFAATIETDNAALADRIDAITALRSRGEPTVPTTIALERATNPFLRADLPELAQAVGLTGAPAHEVYGEIRRRKDGFR
jgi:hydroxyacylglutathione hydrolase